MTSATPIQTTEAEDLRLGDGPYVLMKRGLYWRPNGQGYTGVLAEAGRYGEDDAKAKSEDGTIIMLASEADEFSPACWPETQIKVFRLDLAEARAQAAAADPETVERMRAEIERLRAFNPVDFLRSIQRSTHLPDKYRDAAAILMSGALSAQAALNAKGSPDAP